MAPASLTVIPELTAAQLLAAVDDTNEAPWMTMPEFQFNIVQILVGILRLHSRRRRLGWHVSAELGVRMPRSDGSVLTLGPDLFVVEADEALRTSWDVVREGQPPGFVLEVVTKESVERDTSTELKVGYYAAMGVAEYAVYWPERRNGGPRLFGYRRDPAGAWVDWSTDAHGVLWSATLGGLGLVVAEPPWLRVVDQQGALLPSPEEEADRAEREATARQKAEAEVTRLRALLKRQQD